MSMLKLRAEIKARKPAFIRQDNPKRMKVNDKWRKPKGVHSKIRHKFKGRRKMPSVGYKSPFEARGLHISGMSMVLVSNIEDLSKIDPKKDGVIVSKNIGMKKKLDILAAARAKKLHVLNLNVDDHISKLEGVFAARKNNKKKPVKPAKKEEKEAKPEHKAQKEHAPQTEHAHEHKEDKETKHESHSDEEKKKAEKKEKDRILTQKV